LLATRRHLEYGGLPKSSTLTALQRPQCDSTRSSRLSRPSLWYLAMRASLYTGRTVCRLWHVQHGTCVYVLPVKWVSEAKIRLYSISPFFTRQVIRFFCPKGRSPSPPWSIATSTKLFQSRACNPCTDLPSYVENYFAVVPVILPSL